MSNKYIIGIVVVLLLIGGFFLLSQPNENQQNSSSNNKSSSSNLIPIDSITHGHGLAVDVTDPNRLYIATHHGLLVLVNEKDLYRVGESEDDYMGFSPHPTNHKVFFTSGHPSSGGNVGFQKSEDSGYTWDKVSDGINGPVDFHAMTVSAANPNLIYGWFQGVLQRSTNEGKSWEVATTTNYPIVSLAADPKDENVLYAASPQGLMLSKNKGKDWNSLLDGFVSTIAISPQDSQNLISFSEKLRLARSSDAGEKWEQINENFNGETPLHTAFDKQKPETIYILTEKNSLYKSTDIGNTWSKIR